MSIIKLQKRDRYVVINKKAIEDIRLTWGARGLLCYLLSKPDNWQINVKHLITQSDQGSNYVYARLKELQALGYAKKIAVRESGKITQWDWVIYEEPPLHDFQDVENLHVENPSIINNDHILNNDIPLKGKTRHVKTCMTADWFPPDTLYPNAEKSFGWNKDKVDSYLPEFRQYWIDQKTERKNWAQTFLNHLKRQCLFENKKHLSRQNDKQDLAIGGIHENFLNN